MNVFRKIHALFRKQKLDAEMSEEMRLHLERRTAENVASGMSPEDARYAALRKFGGVEQLKERAREQRGTFWLEEFLRDVRSGARQLMKTPGFTAVAVITLALGIGFNTAMFSLANLLLLKPVPYPDKDRLVRVYRTTPQAQNGDHSAADYLELADSAKDFAELAAFRQWVFSLVDGDRPAVSLNSLRVSGEFFSIIGMRPLLGRAFTKNDDVPGNHVIMLNHATWLAQFGGDPAVIDRTVRIDGEPTTIIGVMPAEFESVFLWGPSDAFRPLALSESEKTERTDFSLGIVGRQGKEFSLAQVNARFAALTERLGSQRPRENSRAGLRAVTLQSVLQPTAGVQMVAMLLGLSGFVLLITCANLANLQLARAVVRTREFAVRAALGASRARLFAPLLTESLLLSIVGGGFGILVATWTNDWLSSRMSSNGFFTITLRLDWRVMGFAMVVSLLTGLVFGLAPAWMTSRVRIMETLKSGARGATGDRTQHRFRQSLIVGQFALALVLLAGAGIFIQGVDRVLKRDGGWETSGLVQGVISPAQTKYPTTAQTHAFYLQLEERLRAMPGVESVGLCWTLPIFPVQPLRNYVVEGRDPLPAGHEPIATVNAVSPGWFDLLKMKAVAGRAFSALDTASSTPVAIINESMARALFPNENPLGRRLGAPDVARRGWVEIVGVVPDQRFAASTLAEARRFQVMRPLAQETRNHVTISVRSKSPQMLIEPMRRVVTELDRDLPVQQLETVKDAIARGTSTFGLLNTILISFAVLGLFLAALGLYGVTARLVQQRTPEIGVRIALGAQAGDIVRLVVGSGVRLALLGTGLGLIGAYGLARAIAVMAPEIGESGLAPITGVTVLLVAVALLACWLPARRAARIDPMTALRAE